jgi:hypothetical protein
MLKLSEMSKAQEIMNKHTTFVGMRKEIETTFVGMTVLWDLVDKRVSIIEKGEEAIKLEKEYAAKANLNVETFREVVLTAQAK